MTDSPTSHLSYDPRFFAKIVQVEDRHFWFCARNRIIAAAAHSVVDSLAPGYRVLEVGCGTGVVLRQLTEVCRDGEVMGMDLYPEAVTLANQRAACRVVVGDILNPPDVGEFDIVAMFDVLEHQTDDRQILDKLNHVVKSGGTLILTVPSRMSLWSYFDVASCHCRRYDTLGLTQVLQESGFDVEYLTEFMVSLFPLLWLLRRVKNHHTTREHELAVNKAAAELTIVPLVNGFLKFILSLESYAVGRRWRFPFGTSLLAVARKREPETTNKRFG